MYLSCKKSTTRSKSARQYSRFMSDSTESLPDCTGTCRNAYTLGWDRIFAISCHKTLGYSTDTGILIQQNPSRPTLNNNHAKCWSRSKHTGHSMRWWELRCALFQGLNQNIYSIVSATNVTRISVINFQIITVSKIWSTW